LIEKSVKQAILNLENVDYDTERLNTKTLNTPIITIPTGIIECVPIKSTTINLVSKLQEKFHNWFYLVSVNKIKYNHKLTLLNESLSTISITPNDAAVLLMYASAKYFKNQLITIHKPLVRAIMYRPLNAKDYVNDLIEQRFSYGYIADRMWNRFNDVDKSIVLPIKINNVIEFNHYIDKIVKSKIQHRLLLGLETNSLGKSELDVLIHIFYKNVRCSFVDETNYTDFFTRLGIDLSTYSDNNLLRIINVILKVYLGINNLDDEFETPYTGTVEILRLLSSYTVQFVEGLGNENIEPIDIKFSSISVGDCTTDNGIDLIDSVKVISRGLNVNQHRPIIKNVLLNRVNRIINKSKVDLFIDKAKFTTQVGSDITYDVNSSLINNLTPAGVYIKLIP
jgi:hypothetical protein